MIPIEALRAWHKSVNIVLKRKFPGLFIQCENQLNINVIQPRWEWAVSFKKPDGQVKYTAGYFTLEQLENEQETVLTMLGEMPKRLEQMIKDELEGYVDV